MSCARDLNAIMLNELTPGTLENLFQRFPLTPCTGTYVGCRRVSLAHSLTEQSPTSEVQYALNLRRRDAETRLRENRDQEASIHRIRRAAAG